MHALLEALGIPACAVAWFNEFRGAAIYGAGPKTAMLLLLVSIEPGETLRIFVRHRTVESSSTVANFTLSLSGERVTAVMARGADQEAGSAMQIDGLDLDVPQIQKTARQALGREVAAKSKALQMMYDAVHSSRDATALPTKDGDALPAVAAKRARIVEVTA